MRIDMTEVPNDERRAGIVERHLIGVGVEADSSVTIMAKPVRITMTRLEARGLADTLANIFAAELP